MEKIKIGFLGNTTIVALDAEKVEQLNVVFEGNRVIFRKNTES
ncbi:hypothetical protein SAMN04487887_103125 [Enterococcus casseliflavus]|nr:hypothetical protein [Enterococcus casseliflavus]SFD70493.1 hypothetical protein SAMN04487887_103125 [Enterococcus casseliflavus]